MIGAPLALLGLLAVAVPVIIHLLGRHQSRVIRFPTLRFIPLSRLEPTRRKRISDWPLLLVRMAIVALGAVALSQPYFACANRSGNAAPATPSRVIVIDTSASMRRPVATGSTMTAIDSARRYVSSLGADAVETTIETADLAQSIAGATAWLAARAGARELLLVSDFQNSSLDAAAMSRVPQQVGVTTVVVPAVGPIDTPGPRERPAAEATEADSPGATIAWSAIGERLPVSGPSRISIAYRDVIASDDVIREPQPLDVPWMRAIVSGLQRDRVLREAARREKGGRFSWQYPIARNDAGQDVVIAERRDSRLRIGLLGDPGGLTSVALNRAVIRLMNPPMAAAELDTTRIPGAVLAAWNRKATPVAGPAANLSDGRWFWLAALLLIGVEAWMRSRLRVNLGVGAETSVAVERAA